MLDNLFEERFKAGDLLMVVDLEAVKEAGKPTTTIVAITNSDDYAVIEPKLGDIEAGKAVLTVK